MKHVLERVENVVGRGENFRKLSVPSHEAYGYQILYVVLYSSSLPRVPKYTLRVKFWLHTGVTSFNMGSFREIFREHPVPNHEA